VKRVLDQGVAPVVIEFRAIRRPAQYPRPSLSPSPRTSPSSGCCACIRRSPARSCSPRSARCACSLFPTGPASQERPGSLLGCRRRCWLTAAGQSITSPRAIIAPRRMPLAIPFCQANDVRLDVPVFNREQLAGPAHPALHFVGDEENAMAVAEPAEARQEVPRRDMVAAFALNRLHEDGRDLIRRRQPLPGWCPRLADAGATAFRALRAVAGKRHVVDVGHQGRETAAVDHLRARQRQWRRRSVRERRRKKAITCERPVCQRANFQSASNASARCW